MLPPRTTLPRLRISLAAQPAASCSFIPTAGPAEFYCGVINKLGVDLGGTRGGVMIWAVYPRQPEQPDFWPEPTLALLPR